MYNRICLILFCTIACLLSIDCFADRFSIHIITAPLFLFGIIGCFTQFCKSKLSSLLSIVIAEFVLINCFVDTFCQEYVGSCISPQIISLIYNTDSRETTEFLSVFCSVGIFTNIRLLCILILMIICPIVLSGCGKKNLLRITGYNGKYRKTVGKGFNLVLLILLTIEVVPICKYLQLLLPNNILETEGMIFNHYHEEVPTPIHRAIYSTIVYNKSKESLVHIKQSTYNANVDSCSHSSKHIVLIIGESYNKHHSSLYGYNYDTTPNQRRRRDNGELYVFSDAVTPWNITSNVFLCMFSMWDCSANSNIKDYPLFPILFKRSGYNVNFYSNQYVTRGIRKGSTNQTGAFFLTDRVLCDSLFSYRNTKALSYDGELVNLVKNNINEEWKQTCSLDIIHLIGQHFDYGKRCPKDCRVFGCNHAQKFRNNLRAQKIITDYDNATYYNDIVLDSIISMYEKEDAIIVFVADHGEEVYDDAITQGRLFTTPSVNIARNEYEVPMWIWSSKLYMENHPQIIEDIARSKDKPFLTDDIPNLLCYLGGIHSSWENENRNILSNTYKHKRRFISGNTDYDSLKLQDKRH